MVDKKKKNQKGLDHEQQKAPETKKKSVNVADIFLDELKGAFTAFDKLSETKKIELYGKKEYLEQFWEYFQKEYSHMLDNIDKQDLPLYIKALENKGFSLQNINKDATKLHVEYKSEDTELHVITNSLSSLKKFCDDINKKIPSTTFIHFADYAGFDAETFVISSDGKLKTIDDLYTVRKKYLEKEQIALGDEIKKQAEIILTPAYNPTERIMVQVAITKIRKELPGSLKKDFDETFPLPITIFSSYQDLLSFKHERADFVADHASAIDDDLAKRLDNIIVTNSDIQNGLVESGSKFTDVKGFSEKEQQYRRIFNALVARQLAEEVNKIENALDKYVNAMRTTFKEFPPYVNEILSIYPFNDKIIQSIDTTLHSDLQLIDDQILVAQEHYVAATDIERKELKKKIHDLKQQREHRKRQAYIRFLQSKEPALADIFSVLVKNKFDFSLLSLNQQQTLVNTLVKHKLEETIQNKVPELLFTTEEELMQFVNDLFDLTKMDLTIPTRHGPVLLTFTKKEFMSSARKELPSLQSLEELKNLPLNFVTQLNEVNAPFFEESVIFKSLYTVFKAKNGDFPINDAYKVKVKKNGKEVIGYLSSYSPIDERNLEQHKNGKELYLYSEPITAPNQERTLLTWDGKDDGIPVVIKDEEQKECDIEVIDKKINLNGDTFGALLFGYVLGQESMVTSMPIAKEKEIGEKYGALNTYKEKDESTEEEPSSISKKFDESKIESSEKTQFMDERKKIAGYPFSESIYQDNHGFVKGTRLFIPYGDSFLPPLGGNARAWCFIEIVDIDEKKGTFTTKLHGGEYPLGPYEGQKKTMPINVKSLQCISEVFETHPYKLPPLGSGFNEEFNTVLASKVATGCEKSFQKIKYDSGKFSFVGGEEAGKEVKYFGIYEPKIGEDPDQESGTWCLYKVKHNPNKTITLMGEFVGKEGGIQKVIRDMDYTNFILFINEKKLQPKSDKQADVLKKQQELKNQETPITIRRFSIKNVIGFFKNTVSKIQDSVKKYDEERAEDFMDAFTNKGKLYSKIGEFLPFARFSAGFETVGADYFLERDNRIRKKIEKRQKYYEDHHFATIYNMYLKPLLREGKKPIPHYKIAALLLTMIKKGKGPYNRNPDLVGKGIRINLLMGPEHQARYLAMRDKKIREIQQNGASYPSTWTDQMRNELVELEMKYIVHVIDGRQLGLSGKDNNATETYLCNKYSRKFAGELETAYSEFFNQETVEGAYNKIPKTTNFEFARFEYFRLISERPQQAIPFLKVMAEKAITSGQRKTFELAVLSGILSGVFLNMTFSDTAGFIQKICRTRGFLPGLWVRDFDQQAKVARLMDIISDGNFSKEVKYQQSNFSFGNMVGFNGKGPVSLIGRDSGKFNVWFASNGDMVSKFLQLTGKAKNGKTLVEMHADPKTSPEDKILLEELIHKSLEKDEDIDSTVKYNPGSLKESVFTKSQSVVNEVIKYTDGSFAGKDKDDIQSMQSFWSEVAKKIPKGKESDAQVHYFLKKFINRFEERGFSDNDRSIFLRRLKTAQQEMVKGHTQQAEDILRYTIVGTIIKNSGRGGVPPELIAGLEGFKNFFKNNLDTILKSTTISDTMGMQYIGDADKPYVCGNWAEYVEVSDPSLWVGLSPQERKLKGELRKKFKNPEYINEELFRLAERLQRDYGISNRFKSYYISKKETTSSSPEFSPPKATGAKIKNSHIIQTVKDILEGKNLGDENDEDALLLGQEDLDMID